MIETFTQTININVFSSHVNSNKRNKFIEFVRCMISGTTEIPNLKNCITRLILFDATNTRSQESKETMCLFEKSYQTILPLPIISGYTRATLVIQPSFTLLLYGTIMGLSYIQIML